MVDYSKWKNIEISDDEDETHPNIDTPSLFRWRHQARIERMEEQQKAIEEFQKKKSENQKKLTETRNKLKEAEKNGVADIDDLKKVLKGLELDEENLKCKFKELELKEKKTPWNIDTISKDGFAKTIINKNAARPVEENLTDEERDRRMKKFIKENEKQLKHLGLLKRYDDTKAYLKSHPHLVCEDTANYLVVWCINLEMDEKQELMAHVAHQVICIQYILELSKQLDRDPRACLDGFFTRIQVAEPEYKASFNDELEQFKERVRKRAAEKLEDALKEVEEEERKNRLGPGGLDPVEVFETLPDELKKCFESQNVALLQETIAKMDEEQVRYHMKRCIDSGLWIPDGNKNKNPDSDSPNTSTDKATLS